MRIYHFINKEYGFEDLREKRLKIARFTELNDPFEFYCNDLSDEVYRNAIIKTKESLSVNTGMLCFSKNWNNPVQWSHYANKHQGLCLGFDIEEEHSLVEVKYVDERLPIKEELTKEIMLELLSTKYSHWSYEKEYRIFLTLNDEINGFYYADFSDQMKLKQVIVGAQSNITRNEVINAFGEFSNSIEILKARKSFTAFRMVKNETDSF